MVWLRVNPCILTHPREEIFNKMDKKNKILTNHEVERFLESSLKMQRKKNLASDPHKKLVREKDYDPNCPKPEDFIEYYSDGTHLKKITSYIRAVAKYIDQEESKDKK